MKQFWIYLYPDKYTKKLNKLFAALGEDSSKKINTYLTIRLVIEVILYGISCLCLPYGYLVGLVFVAVFHSLYESLFLYARLRKRSHMLEEDSIEFLEAWSLTLKSDISPVKSLEVASRAVTNHFTKEIRKHTKQSSLEKIALAVHKSIPTKRIRGFLIEVSRVNSKEELQSLLDSYLKEEYRTKEIQDNQESISMIIRIIFVSILFLIVMAGVIYLTPYLVK